MEPVILPLTQNLQDHLNIWQSIWKTWSMKIEMVPFQGLEHTVNGTADSSQNTRFYENLKR